HPRFSEQRGASGSPLFLVYTMLNRIKEIHPATYIKGGYVRDKILGIESRDIDFMCIGEYDELLAKFNDTFDWAVPAGKAHSTFLTQIDGEKFEVTVHKSILEHQQSCDFTINALLLEEQDKLQVRGQGFWFAHVRMGILKAVSIENLYDDPIRAIRGIRFKHKYDLRVIPTTQEAINDIIPKLTLCDKNALYGVSKYRSLTEMQKIFELPNAKEALAELNSLGLQSEFNDINDNYGYFDNIAHSLKHYPEDIRRQIYKKYGFKVVERKTFEKIINDIS
ncbi:MAG: hypothetical protein R3309_13125, partial [Reinekea sp.]|nr:hypothetical protein [Reinekea sp.]